MNRGGDGQGVDGQGGDEQGVDGQGGDGQGGDGQGVDEQGGGEQGVDEQGGDGEYSDLDLDIHNYTLQDLLNLLQLPSAFTATDLRNAMRLVGRLHPDKSDAPPTVFRLFYEAHVLCRQLLAARSQGGGGALVREDYDTVEGAAIADEMVKRDDFSQWFNQSFEEYHKTLPQKSEGYSAWLGEPVQEGGRVRSQAQMGAAMAKRRKVLARQAVVLADGPVAAEMGGGTMLVASEEAPIGLAGGMVGDVAYGDLKQSYEESVVPVAGLDGLEPREYSTMNELLQARAGLDEAAKEHWGSDARVGETERRKREAQASGDARMYALHQQHEEQLAAHTRWKAATLRLTDLSDRRPR